MRKVTVPLYTFVTPDYSLAGPMALKLRPNLIEEVERCLYFRFNVWPWQFIAKTDTKAVWKSLEKGQTLPVPGIM